MNQEEDGYRSQILERLDEVQMQNKQTEIFFNNYSKLAEQMRRNRFDRRGSHMEKGNAEVLKIKQEISELYKAKSQNDQLLIDTNQKVKEYETRITAVQADKSKLEKDKNDLCGKYASMEVEIQRLRVDNVNINDERIALSTTCNSLGVQIHRMEDERLQLLNKIRELNEQRIECMNAEVALEERRQNMRLQETINSAIADTSRDAKVMAMLNAMPERTTGDCLMGDIVPSCVNFSEPCVEGEVNAICWLTGETFATGGADRKCRIWRAGINGTHSKVNSLLGCNAAITRIDFERERNHLLATCNDNNVRIWNCDTGRVLSTLSGHSDQVTCGKFYTSHNAVSGGGDRIIKVWDLSNQRCSRSLFPASKVTDIVTHIGSSPTTFASGHFDKKVRFWDGRSNEPVKEVVMEAKITSLDVSIGGYEMLCSTRDDTISMIDVRTFGLLHSYSAAQYRTSSDYSRCVISAGGDYIAAGSANGLVFIWNKTTTKLEKTLNTKLEHAILSVSWNPTGKGVLSGSKQKTVTHWH